MMNNSEKLALSKETPRGPDDQDLTGVVGGGNHDRRRGGGGNSDSFGGRGICVSYEGYSGICRGVLCFV